MSKLKVRYNLNGRTIKRNFSDLNKPLGTQQLVAIINWGFKENFNRVDGMHWIPVPADELAKMKIPNDPRRIRELQEKSPPHIKYTGSFSGKKDLFSVKHYYKSYKVTVQGRLVKYHRLKLQTDLYILPISWNAKSQIASAPYAWINDELKKITHIIETTFQEVIKLKDFSKERLDELLKERMKNGMPRHIYVPANIAANNAQAIHEISKTLAKDAGIEAYDIRNPKNVPDDLTEFIDYYYKNTIKLKKGSDETYERHQQFKRKLIRWYEATGKKLSITLSDEVNIGDFLKWRMYDNQENIVRNSKNVKSKNQITKIRDEAVAVSTLNKARKDIIFFYNRSVDNFSCKPTLSTKHAVLKEEPDDREDYDVYLSMNQIQEILSLRIEEGTRLYKHRILFCLGCLGGGYRVSDLVKLPRPVLEKFDDEFYYTFNVRSTKTKVRTKAPIPPELNFLVEGYDFDEKVKVHDFRDDIKKLGLLCGWEKEYKYKKKLADGTEKNISEPYYKMLMTKTCRKSYCSLLYNFWGLPISECMEFSGHKTEEEFKKYLQIDREEKARRLIKEFKVKPIFIG